MSKRLNIEKVLNTKVKQSIAGYKSNYVKRIKNARSKSERQALEKSYPKFIANIEAHIVNALELGLANWVEGQR